jgi:sigma-E factor negative regulatory protein RseA
MDMKESELIGEKISSFMDGELSGPELDKLMMMFKTDISLVRHWERYHIISDALKNNLPRYLNHDLANRVKQAVDTEPTIIAPNNFLHNISPVVKQIAGLAVAASVMAVAILATQGFIKDGEVAPQLAKVPQMPSSDQFDRVAQNKLNPQQLPPNIQKQLDKFLVNHNQYAPGMHGVLPYARIIGYSPQRQDD